MESEVRSSAEVPCTSEGPVEGMGLFSVPVVDVAKRAFDDLGDVGEASVPKYSSLQDGEPELHLVHPGRVLRRVDECEPVPMPFVEGGPSSGLDIVVDVQVIPEHDDGSRIARHHLLHELNEVVQSVTFGSGKSVNEKMVRIGVW